MAQERTANGDVAKFIREQASSITSEDSGLTDISEKLHRIAVLPFRDLLTDPVGPAPIIKILPEDRLLPANKGLVAIGVHSAGEYLPTGRHSVVYVNKQSLVNSASRQGVIGDKDYGFFLELFNKVYRQVFGRQYTLIHTLLHSAQKDGALIEIPLGTNIGESYREPSPPISGTNEIIRLNLDGVLEALIDQAVLDKFVKAIWTFTPAEAGAQISEPNPQLTDLYSGKIATLLRTEKDPRKTWYCFFHTFNRNVQRATIILEDTDQKSINKLLAVIYGGTAVESDDHTAHTRLQQAVTMLQLFFLYREICGKWFYVIVPDQQQHLSMCFTVGAERRLTQDELDRLRKHAADIRTELKYDLTRAHEKYINKHVLQSEWQVLEKIIGPTTLEALSNKGISKKNYGTTLGGGLPLYLKFCERISELAIHEGKKLHFDIVVSGGMFASEMLSKVSNLCSNGSRQWSVLLDNADDTSPVNLQIISQLLGNYEFMQEKGVVLFGSRDGHLLYLAKMLNPQQNPEVFTEGKYCYLLQVRANGDIHMFYNGQLVLWRRAGQYIVPEAYGSEYRKKLTEWLSNNFDGTHVNYNVLAEVIWSLSSDERGGGSFVLGHMDKKNSFQLQSHTYALSEVFPYAEGLPLVDTGSTELLKQLAVQDGAVVIDVDTGRVFGRRQLLPNKPFDWHQHLPEWESEGELKWDDWHKVLRWGTRHHSALAFSAAATSAAPRRKRTAAATLRRPVRGAAVITVSSDGEIHVFYGPRPEPALTYPQHSLSMRQS